jgi:hypothetical protein
MGIRMMLPVDYGTFSDRELNQLAGALEADRWLASADTRRTITGELLMAPAIAQMNACVAAIDAELSRRRQLTAPQYSPPRR